jgi:hypothetical protein
MSLTFAKDKDNDGLYIVTITGLFLFEDQKKLEDQARESVDWRGRVRFLIDATRFLGWGKEGDWGDLAFVYEHDVQIEKIAIVAPEKWRDEILMFVGSGRRKAEVVFFGPEQKREAHDWAQ